MGDGFDQYEQELLEEWKQRHEEEVLHLDSGITIDSYEVVFLLEQHLAPSEFIVVSFEEDLYESSEIDTERAKLREEIIDRIANEPETDLAEIWELMTQGRIFINSEVTDVNLIPDEWAINFTTIN